MSTQNFIPQKQVHEQQNLKKIVVLFWVRLLTDQQLC